MSELSFLRRGFKSLVSHRINSKKNMHKCKRIQFRPIDENQVICRAFAYVCSNLSKCAQSWLGFAAWRLSHGLQSCECYGGLFANRLLKQMLSCTKCAKNALCAIKFQAAYQGANPGAIASSSPTAIPSRLRAPIVQFLYTRVEDLGALTNGMFEVGTDGVVQVGLEGLTGPSAFGAGVAGWTQAVVIIYNI